MRKTGRTEYACPAVPTPRETAEASRARPKAKRSVSRIGIWVTEFYSVRRHTREKDVRRLAFLLDTLTGGV